MESGVVITITDPTGTNIVDCPWLPGTTRKTPAMKTKQPQHRRPPACAAAGVALAPKSTKTKSTPCASSSPLKRNNSITRGSSDGSRRSTSPTTVYRISISFRLRLRLAIRCLMLLPPRYATTVPWVKASLGALLALLIGRFCVPFLPTAWLRRSRCITTFAAFTTFVFTSLSLSQRVPSFPSLRLPFVAPPNKRIHARKRSSQHAVIFPVTPVSRARRIVQQGHDLTITTPAFSAAAMDTQLVASPANITISNDNHLNAFDDTSFLPHHPSSNGVSLPAPIGTVDALTSCTSPTKRDLPFQRPLLSHTRAKSLADGGARHQKRLSLNIPIQPLPSPGSRPTSWYGAASPLPSPQSLISPVEETSFLAKLAAQERRVLELKDELKQAELELQNLKRQWAHEEANKQRGDVRKVHQLQPLSVNFPPLELLEDDEDGSSEWMQKEMERRKTLMSHIRPSNRKVFSGSKHMRTLSLLSPERGHFTQPFPQPTELARSPGLESPPNPFTPTTNTIIPKPLPRVHEEHAEPGPAPSKDVLLKTGKQMAVDIKEGLITFFEDLRQATVGDEGINGTESRITESGPRTTSSNRKNAKSGGSSQAGIGFGQHRRSSPATSTAPKRPASFFGTPSDPLIDIAASFWRDHGIDASPAQVKTKKAAATHRKTISLAHPATSTPRSERSDTWDTWDSPSSSAAAKGTPTRAIGSSSSPIVLQASPSSPSTLSDSGTGTAYSQRSPTASTERTMTPRSSAETASSPSLDRLKLQMSFGGTDLINFADDNEAPRKASERSEKRDAIPWPALTKLTPTNLRRTASHLMAEWERSLSPPPPQITSPSIQQKVETPSRTPATSLGTESPSALRGEGKARKKE